MSCIGGFPQIPVGIVVKRNTAATFTTLRLLMFLEADVVNLNIRIRRVAAEVEEQGYLLHVYSVHIGKLVLIGSIRLNLVTVRTIEHIVVSGLNQFDGYTADILSGEDRAAEVVLLVCG